MTITIGCDPEFFLKHKDSGEFVSAHDILPGTKHEPYKLDKGAVQVDGTAVEFNINPASTSEEFVGNITDVLRQIREMVPNSLEFKFLPWIYYKKDYFKALPGYTKVLGCEPDFSAFDLKPIKRSAARLGSLRTGSGHIHVGYTKDQDVNDFIVLNDCAYLTKKVGSDYENTFFHIERVSHVRKKLYGHAGAFRPKPYGIEDRTPSNIWLNYPSLWPYIFEVYRKRTQYELDGKGGWYYSVSVPSILGFQSKSNGFLDEMNRSKEEANHG